MQEMRGIFLRKLKLNPTISNLKQSLVLQLNPQDVFFNSIYDDHKGINNLAELEDVVDDDVDNHFEEEEMDLEVKTSNKDKATPTIGSKETKHVEEKLLALASNNLCKTNMNLNIVPSIEDFEELCPPGGTNSVIFYTTSLRGIRKTFQDCNTIHFLLRSFKILYQERDVSLHLEYREELWKILGRKVIPPKLFVKGRYIGGADEVVGLHEMGWLGKLLEGMAIDNSECTCIGCSNIRFVICSNCCGSCKVFTSNRVTNDECFIKCAECNENGLVKCPICS
ncbi:hypothetical protein TanjilG_19807 [Lupinus angustifolius]|uniref:Glutaredoxin domain-containing protein n=1 Tax=Lupinus angustifolius TaxID=3871 RepID=A0A1J7GX68_LUPAN|nr:PREDICTED: uncharacterized protein At3g28850-like [Lupinus angustifolius]OIW05176.1 hypothetical protein TanjilG_19807 [Lupinus angustifolius]